MENRLIVSDIELVGIKLVLKQQYKIYCKGNKVKGKVSLQETFQRKYKTKVSYKKCDKSCVVLYI